MWQLQLHKLSDMVAKSCTLHGDAEIVHVETTKMIKTVLQKLIQNLKTTTELKLKQNLSWFGSAFFDSSGSEQGNCSVSRIGCMVSKSPSKTRTVELPILDSSEMNPFG